MRVLRKLRTCLHYVQAEKEKTQRLSRAYLLTWSTNKCKFLFHHCPFAGMRT